MEGPDDLLSKIFHVLADQVVAGRVEEDGETPRVAEGDQMRLAREEVDIEDSEYGDLLAGDGGLVETLFHVRREH